MPDMLFLALLRPTKHPEIKHREIKHPSTYTSLDAKAASSLGGRDARCLCRITGRSVVVAIQLSASPRNSEPRGCVGRVTYCGGRISPGEKDAIGEKETSACLCWPSPKLSVCQICKATTRCIIFLLINFKLTSSRWVTCDRARAWSGTHRSAKRRRRRHPHQHRHLRQHVLRQVCAENPSRPFMQRAPL